MISRNAFLILRDRSLITGRGGGGDYQTERDCSSVVLPLEIVGGAWKVLAMVKGVGGGGTKVFG